MSYIKNGLIGLLVPFLIIGDNSKIINQVEKNSPISNRMQTEILAEDTSIENLVEYDSFIKANINKFYISDIEEVYNFFNIKRDLPKYGFKANKRQFIYSDCEGAVYLASDSIYFYSSCNEEIFLRYKKMMESEKEKLVSRLHHNIKHEAAHAFYYNLAKEINKEEKVKKIPDNISFEELLKETLVSEGVAEYIAYKGELTREASMLSNENLKSITERDEYNMYNLGFILVKPILDINFTEGVKTLIENSLTSEDLNNLIRYQEKILAKLNGPSNN